MKLERVKLMDICEYESRRIKTDILTTANYISTENMQPNRKGVVHANSLPTVGLVTMFEKSQILISNIRPYFKKIWMAKFDGGCSNDILCFKLKDKDKVDSKYFYYLLSQDSFFDYVMSGSKGTKMPRGDRSQILNFEFDLPSIKEQERIAAILGALDDKIELNNKINKNLEEQASALFKHWFLNSKKEYEYSSLGDVIETTSGGTPSRKDLSFYRKGTIKWVKSKELKGTYLFDTEEKITEDAINKSSAKLLPVDSVLIAMYGATVGEYAVIAEEMACNQAICALIPNEKYPSSFLFMIAKIKQEELINLAVGSAQQNISQVLIKQLKVPNCIDLIKAYDEIVLPFLKVMKVNIEENLRLTELRNSLLPKLMNNDFK